MILKECNFRDIVKEMTGTRQYSDAVELFNFWIENELVLTWETKIDTFKDNILGTLTGFWVNNSPIQIFVPGSNGDGIYFDFNKTETHPADASIHIKATKSYVNEIFVQYIKNMKTLVENEY